MAQPVEQPMSEERIEAPPAVAPALLESLPHAAAVAPVEVHAAMQPEPPAVATPVAHAPHVIASFCCAARHLQGGERARQGGRRASRSGAPATPRGNLRRDRGATATGGNGERQGVGANGHRARGGGVAPSGAPPPFVRKAFTPAISSGQTSLPPGLGNSSSIIPMTRKHSAGGFDGSRSLKSSRNWSKRAQIVAVFVSNGTRQILQRPQGWPKRVLCRLKHNQSKEDVLLADVPNARTGADLSKHPVS